MLPNFGPERRCVLHCIGQKRASMTVRVPQRSSCNYLSEQPGRSTDPGRAPRVSDSSLIAVAPYMEATVLLEVESTTEMMATHVKVKGRTVSPAELADP